MNCEQFILWCRRDGEGMPFVCCKVRDVQEHISIAQERREKKRKGEEGREDAVQA